MVWLAEILISLNYMIHSGNMIKIQWIKEDVEDVFEKSGQP